MPTKAQREAAAKKKRAQEAQLEIRRKELEGATQRFAALSSALKEAMVDTERARVVRLEKLHAVNVNVVIHVPDPGDTGKYNVVHAYVTKNTTTGVCTMHFSKANVANALNDPDNQLSCQTGTITQKLRNVGTARLDLLYSKLAHKGPLEYLTQTGIAYLLEQWRATRPLADALLVYLRDTGYLPLDDAVARLVRKEYEYMRVALRVFKKRGHTLEVNPQRQFFVRQEDIDNGLAFRSRRAADGFCPELLIDVECDERNHAGYDPVLDSHECRESDVKLALNNVDVCFYYFNPDARDFSVSKLKKELKQLIARREAELCAKKKKPALLEDGYDHQVWNTDELLSGRGGSDDGDHVVLTF